MNISSFDWQQKFEPTSYTNYEREKILRFLESGEPFGVGGRVQDVFMGEYTPLENAILEKDGYEWAITEAYHFEKYNLPLNEDFVNYVLKKSC